MDNAAGELMIRAVNFWRKAMMNKGHIFTASVIIASGILTKSNRNY